MLLLLVEMSQLWWFWYLISKLPELLSREVLLAVQPGVQSGTDPNHDEGIIYTFWTGKKDLWAILFSLDPKPDKQHKRTDGWMVGWMDIVQVYKGSNGSLFT